MKRKRQDRIFQSGNLNRTNFSCPLEEWRLPIYHPTPERLLWMAVVQRLVWDLEGSNGGMFQEEAIRCVFDTESEDLDYILESAFPELELKEAAKSKLTKLALERSMQESNQDEAGEIHSESATIRGISPAHPQKKEYVSSTTSSMREFSHCVSLVA